MNNKSMIHQLIDGADNKVSQIILGTENVKFYANNLTQSNIDALIINNSLPLKGAPDATDLLALRDKGVEHYPAGRTGIPSLVTAEDGLAAPGVILASDDKNLLELSVLGTYVLHLEKENMLALMNDSQLDLSIPESKNIELTGKAGEWVGGIDIALHLIHYFNLPKDKVLEFYGEGLTSLPLNERFSLARTLIDLGYEKLLFQVDEQVLAFLQDRSEAEGQFYFPDTEADKNTVLSIGMEKVHPMIAWKENNETKVGALTDKDGLNIEQIFIGGESANRYADIESGLKLIRYRPLSENLTAAIIPGSQLVYGDMLDMGISGILTEIGFEILPSSILPLLKTRADEKKVRLVTSASLVKSGAILANALSCFTAAITGKLTHPMELESILKQEEEKEHAHEH